MELRGFLLAWRTTPLHDREVIDALVDPIHAGPSPALLAALARWPGRYYWSDEPDGRHLVLTRLGARPRRERWWLHLALFLATLVTTTFAGAILAGAIPYDNPLDLLVGSYPIPDGVVRAWETGFAFSLPLLAFLLAHEFGHYLTARWYQLDVSPPYFIPVPLFPTFIGTMGAFIRLRTVLSDRRQLLDVGAAGPLAGFVVALPVLWIGLLRSHALPGHPGAGGMLLPMGDWNISIGDSLITLVLRHLVHPGAAAVLLSPIAFAGYMGMFITALNLVPISQLDGGHILFAALPRWHQRVALAFWFVALALGLFWVGWLVWGVLVLALSRGRLGHPPVLDSYRPLPRSRPALAWASAVLFAITFTPVPFKV
ncbi:MAG TPA: site-2 protease family protein [Gemmatimonadales bacterium]|nr:site-2 protease family protein [Gemmatimonadales bacterium]